MFETQTGVLSSWLVYLLRGPSFKKSPLRNPINILFCIMVNWSCFPSIFGFEILSLWLQLSFVCREELQNENPKLNSYYMPIVPEDQKLSFEIFKQFYQISILNIPHMKSTNPSYHQAQLASLQVHLTAYLQPSMNSICHVSLIATCNSTFHFCQQQIPSKKLISPYNWSQ